MPRQYPNAISSIFGSKTFNLEVMREKLSQKTFFSLKRTLESGEKLQPEISNEVAHAMKEWALENGATHYCHWFQPMTGSTAEKHDAFLSFDSDGAVVERFSGSQLLQGEPDASSFPSGGMRSTFEARGYTAWDPSSPAFLMSGPQGLTLCIPSVYLSYHGEALDEKTPLLRSIAALSKSAVRMLHILGNSDVKKVNTFIGIEQEYFLVDSKLYKERTDLVFTGRTLLGRLPPKGQQMEDHYFGSIPDRVLDFMSEVEKELYMLGVPAKTRHNEVAPHQYEIAPIHENANIANDHNLLVMEIMRKIATRKGLTLLLHEKPFASINGSGKHNNWSMGDSLGRNLLDPGKTPESNLQFLVFLLASLKAVYKRSTMLRAAIASAGNDHRLGANEAPPAIMSVFLGHQLDKILHAIEKGEVTEPNEPQFLNLGLSQLPTVLRDNTDRNRTSPFAFTGNKFEFRAVPSSMSVANPNTILNSAVAEALDEMADKIQSRLSLGADLKHAVFEVVREEIKITKSIRFEGDGYSFDWASEADSRRLPNIKNTPDALKAWLDIGNRRMLLQYGVFTETELDARYHVKMEQYVKQIDIEAKTILSMVKSQILPSCFKYQQEIAESFLAIENASNKIHLPSSVHLKQSHYLENFAVNLSQLLERIQTLEESIYTMHFKESLEEKATYCVEHLILEMARLRETTDRLEGEVGASLWPIPTYADLLFTL